MQVNCVCKSRTSSAAGFTILELLVTLSILALLASLITIGVGIAQQKARQAKCMGNQKQLGVAIVSYIGENNGSFPMTSHGLDASRPHDAWVFTLSDYLANVDEIRICPADPKASARLEANGTSYVLNSFLTVASMDPFGRNLGGYTHVSQVPSPASTPLAFVINFAKGVGYANDHTHSDSWTSWRSVLNDIQPDAFGGNWKSQDRTRGSSNYLYADGHVENLNAAQVREWITSGHNFADPAQHSP